MVSNSPRTPKRPAKPANSRFPTTYERLLNPGKYRSLSRTPIKLTPGRNGYCPPLSPSPLRRVVSGEDIRKVSKPVSKSSKPASKRNGVLQEHMYLNAKFPWWPGAKIAPAMELPDLDQGIDNKSMIVSRNEANRHIDLTYNSYLRISQYVEVRMLDVRTKTWGMWHNARITAIRRHPVFRWNRDIVMYECGVVYKNERIQPPIVNILAFAGEIRHSTEFNPHACERDIDPVAAFRILNSLHTVFAIIDEDQYKAQSPRIWVPARIVENMYNECIAIDSQRYQSIRQPNVACIVYHPAWTPPCPVYEVFKKIWRKELKDTNFACPWPPNTHPKGFCEGLCVKDDADCVLPYTRRSIGLIQGFGDFVHTIPVPLSAAGPSRRR